MSPSDPRPLLCFFNDSPWSSSLEETVPDQVEVNKLTLLHPHHKQLGLNNNKNYIIVNNNKNNNNNRHLGLVEVKSFQQGAQPKTKEVVKRANCECESCNAKR